MSAFRTVLSVTLAVAVSVGAQDDTLVKFIGSEITYTDYSDPVRVPTRDNGVDTVRWDFGVAAGDSLWGNGGSRTIHGGMEFYGDAARGARLENPIRMIPTGGCRSMISTTTLLPESAGAFSLPAAPTASSPPVFRPGRRSTSIT